MQASVVSLRLILCIVYGIVLVRPSVTPRFVCVKRNVSLYLIPLSAGSKRLSPIVLHLTCSKSDCTTLPGNDNFPQGVANQTAV
jgi:hypothetical protein